MLEFLHWLKRPFPLVTTPKHLLRQALVGGCFVCFFLYVFRPFGMQDSSVSHARALQIGAKFGAVTFVCSLIWGAILHVFPRFFDEKHWNIGRETLSTLFMISLIATGNMLLANWWYQSPFSFDVLLYWIWATSIIGIFPILLGIFFKQIRLTRQFAAEAGLLNTQIQASTAVPKQETIITLRGDNQGEELSLPLSALLYLEADGNYVSAVYYTEKGVASCILRTTLRHISESLIEHPQVFRCHRSYMVNLEQVSHLSGNAQGLKIHLRHTQVLVPVSRALNQVIRTQLKTA